MADAPFSGHCMCGAVSYTVSQPPNWVGHCHCTDCRRHVAGAVATFIGCQESAFELNTGDFKSYESSPGVERLFCAECGTPMAYRAQNMPGEIHLLLGTAERPEDFPPIVEVFCKERLPWLQLAVEGASFDALPEAPN